MDDIRSLKAGIGSFAFRYAIGLRGKSNPGGMEPEDFIVQAAKLGYGGVQLCENLEYEDLPDSRIVEIGRLAESLGLFLELGMRNLTKERFFKHIGLAERTGARFLRIVIGDNKPLPENDPDIVTDEVVEILKESMPKIEHTGITVGIENHFDIPNEAILRIMREVGHPRLGTVLDTTNCLGFLKSPAETLEILGPFICSLHVKDYEIRKAEGGYSIGGVVLGKGAANPEALIGRALAFNPDASIILEMSLRRETAMEPEALIAWELEKVKENTDVLFGILRKSSPMESLRDAQQNLKSNTNVTMRRI